MMDLETLQNSLRSHPMALEGITPHLRPVSVYRVKDEAHLGDWDLVTEACRDLGISPNEAYACLVGRNR